MMTMLNGTIKSKYCVSVLCAVIILLVAGCISLKSKSKTPYYRSFNPPNGVRINANMFCDRTELNNFSWLEYMYWHEKVYGKDSEKYQSVLPDEGVWSSLDSCSCLSDYSDVYLRHPAYRDYPVVGVSQKQALEFTKWRTDRVYELLLIREEVIEHVIPDSSSFFTVEKYWSGEYLDYKPDTNYRTYYEFRLPNETEFEIVKGYNDSLVQSELEDCKSRMCMERKLGKQYQLDIEPCLLGKFSASPTIIFMFEKSFKGEILNLTGNVREWSCEESITFGGGWSDSLQEPNSKYKAEVSGYNAFTGFRNVGSWKLYSIDN